MACSSLNRWSKTPDITGTAAGLLLLAVIGGPLPARADGCSAEVLAAHFAADPEFDVLLEAAEVRVNGNAAPSSDLPELQQSTAGSVTIRLGTDGALSLAHSDSYLTGQASLIDATAWDWEAESRLTAMALAPLDAEQTLGCSNGDLPRWRFEYVPAAGVEMSLELVLIEPSVFAGRLASITHGPGATFEVERGLGLFRN